ncbi:nitrogen regulator protein NIfR3 [Nitritalea halalkaliphila LW7]|uniref:Nitrogen regulator protein NIfR3 n=1 Tax=Nitritalea halalkaliphila LW7 TaxID=1189621 RepID=I5CA99_9BACT|nr:nitrogen regulator protein NIfR3 [Nitritalea halalkaliphila LW7]
MVKIGNLALGDFPLLLAPMEDVSDPPFRAVCKQEGADLMYTEFISSEGLIRDAAKSVQKLDIYDYERPIGIQIFGSEIESMRQAAEIAEAAGPDILDINYGCPVHKVACKGAGAGILLDIDKMVSMTAEIVKQVKIPVTVKPASAGTITASASWRWPKGCRMSAYRPSASMPAPASRCTRERPTGLT